MQAPKKFVGLHCHSGASTFDGMGPPNQHIDYVLSNGMDAWSLTDHGHMNGFATAYLYAEKLAKAGKVFKFIPGVEAYVHPSIEQWRLDKQQADEHAADVKKAKVAAKKAREGILTNIERIGDSADETVAIETNNALTVENEDETKSGKSFNPVNRRHHLVILPKTPDALKKIFSLVSRGYLEGFYRFPRIDLRMIKEVANGDNDIIISSACLGGIFSYEVLSQLRYIAFDKMDARLLDDQSLMNKVVGAISNTYDKYADAVGTGNVMLELQFNRLPAQDVVNRAIIEFARRNSLTNQLVVTADSHYAGPDLWYHREMYKKLGYLNYGEYGPESLPKSKDEIKADLYPKNAGQIWDEYQGAKQRQEFYGVEDCDQLVYDAIERTHDIAHNVIGDISFDKKYKFPQRLIPKGKTPIETLVDMSKKGLISKNLHQKPEYIERLRFEIGIIKKMGFAEYFVTLSRVMELARTVCLCGVARGSGGGSLVAYCLNITDLDPIKYECRFDRFLNVHRCLHPSTFVMTGEGGYVRIADVKPGDIVISGKGQQRAVKNVYRTIASTIYKISVGREQFICSTNHKWIIIRGPRTLELPTNELVIGDSIPRAGNQSALSIDAIETVGAGNFELIDIEVEQDHTFFISQTGSDWFLTHNSGAPDIDCLRSDHLISTPKGYVTLKNIKVGDIVYDASNHERCVTWKQERAQKIDELCYEILVLKDGTYGSIIASENHRLLDESGEPIFVKNIDIGDSLHPGNVRVVSKSVINVDFLTDITVQESHTFQVVPFDIVQLEKNQRQYLIHVDMYIDEIQEDFDPDNYRTTYIR